QAIVSQETIRRLGRRFGCRNQALSFGFICTLKYFRFKSASDLLEMKPLAL
uniref:Family with sequence similarity 133 member B n=1 Tax=Poecilia formosa TaxID=48698 RepID=A0A096M3P6_POEFO